VGSRARVCTADAARRDWQSFPRHEEGTPVADDEPEGADAEPRPVLPEVRDECCFGDLAGGLGDSSG
jgi:hypothetical protein